jgi:hypothetical protein
VQERATVEVARRMGPPPVAPHPGLGLEKPRGPAACPAACLVELCGRSSPPRRRSRAALPRRALWPRASSTPRASWLSPPPPRVRRGHCLLRLIVCHGHHLYRERELGEELYQRERGATIGGGLVSPPVVPHRHRVTVRHAADAPEPRERVA